MKNNRIHQRALSLLLSIALLFGMIPMTGIPAFAADSGGGVTAYYNGSGLFKDSGCTDAATDYDYLGTITRVVVKDGTKTIGVYAFEDCKHLAEITIPESVTEIGESAFQSCDSLTEITLPSHVVTIGAGAFRFCENLTGITIPASVTSIGFGAFTGCSNLQAVTFAADSQLTSIAEQAFADCTKLTKVTIPANVMSIGIDAFYDCTAMQSITVSANNSNYSSDGGCLFSRDGTELIAYPAGKTGVYQVPDSVTSIGNDAFSYSSLTGILYGTSSRLTSVGDGAFSGCNNLKSMILPENLQSIPSALFDSCSSLTSVTIPKHITSVALGIDNSAFSDCYSLKEINVEPGNTQYSSYDGALYTIGTDGVLTLVFCPWGKDTCKVKAGTASIGEGAFEDCFGLTDITLPESLTSIEENAFKNCVALSRIELPESVKNAGSDLFQGCTCLKSVTISANTSFQDDSFDFSTTDNLYVVKGTGETDHSPVCGNKFYFAKSADGSSYRFLSYTGTKVGVIVPTELYGKPISPAIRESNLAATLLVAYLKGYSFYSDSEYQNEIDENRYCEITSVVIGSNVTYIGRSAFTGCSSLTEINIPASVINISNGSFSDCSALRSFTVASDNPQYCSRDNVLYKKEDSGKFSLLCCPRARTGNFEIPADVDTIEDNAFAGCTELTGITIPTGVAEIGNDAFIDCNKLTSLTVPAGVTEIGDEAFKGCTGLNTVLLEGAATEIGDCTFYLERNNPPLTVYVPQANLDFYNYQVDDEALEGTSAEIKAIPVISAFDAPSQQILVSMGTVLADLNLPQTLSATVNGTPHNEVNGVTWNADRPYDPSITGTYSFTAVLPFYCQTANHLSLPKLLVRVVSPSESHSSGAAVPFHPSGVTDAATNAQVDLSGATLPAGVTSVSLSVTPEAENGAPATPGTAGSAPDPQGAAAFQLVVSDAALNIIGTPVLYNLKLLDQSGNPVSSFTGSVTVRIPVPAGIHGTPHVFRYEESTGTLTDLGATVQDGFLVFSTTHFSYYFVAGVGDSVALDTRNYQMPVNGKYQIGLKLTGSKAASIKVTSTNEKVAAATRLKNGNVSVTGKGLGASYIMIDVYDNKNHLLTHASVKIDVKTGIRPRGDSTRQIGVF